MNKTMLAISVCWIATLQPTLAWADTDHEDDHDETELHVDHQHDNDDDDHMDHDEEEHESHDDHGDEQATTISQESADRSGVTTAQAGAGVLERTIKTYGRVVVPSDQISHIRARFPGLIQNVAVGIGDSVNAGDLLASVEANESLKSYAITAPIGGIVTQRHANAGELALDQVLFSIVNPGRLWAELRIFEGQLAEVKAEQPILISSATQRADSIVQNIIPSLDDHPFVVARAVLDNTSGAWSPGMFVEGDIVVETHRADLVVDNRALQTLEGRRGVFARHGERYEFHPLTLGHSDGRFSEVLAGLSIGDRYVVENSYLIRADIEKSGAEHDH